MKLQHIILAALTSLCEASLSFASQGPIVHDLTSDVTYRGVSSQGIETFFSIPYGQDTGGENRFKAPQPYVPIKGSVINAIEKGPACPQPHGDYAFPLYLSNVTKISEDCLHVNVYRPEGTGSDAKLPVMLYIHGGSFFIGSKDELTIQPEGLILRSVEMDHPVVVVNINYRLGSEYRYRCSHLRRLMRGPVFGFAQSDALQAEGSTNAGLRDQRLAIEWTRDHISNFGGDPNQITILGQSSGGRLLPTMSVCAHALTKTQV